MMCGPLIDGEGKSFGVLQVDSTRPNAQFKQEDLDLFLSVAAPSVDQLSRTPGCTSRSCGSGRREHDLEVADQIQRSLLPRTPPELPGYAFFSYYQPAHGRWGATSSTTCPWPTDGWRCWWPTWWGHGLEGCAVDGQAGGGVAVPPC